MGTGEPQLYLLQDEPKFKVGSTYNLEKFILIVTTEQVFNVLDKPHRSIAHGRRIKMEKQCVSVARVLMNIFSLQGAPGILQSDNGKNL